MQNVRKRLAGQRVGSKQTSPHPLTPHQVCYVCSIERSMFDRHTKRGFEFHVRNDHWKWNCESAHRAASWADVAS